MNNINIIEHLLSIWWPWLSFWAETTFLQVILIYLVIILFITTSAFYMLLYLLSIIFFIGLSISLYQAELFTGFLWVVELTLCFIILILILYINIENSKKIIELTIIQYKYFLFSYIIIFIIIFFNAWTSLENFLPISLNYIDLWDNFYEALINTNNNDFTALFYSYYKINFIEFIFFGFILFIASIVCVNLGYSQQLLKILNYIPFIKMFNLKIDIISFIFMRKQLLYKQARFPSSVRVFKQKNNY